MSDPIMSHEIPPWKRDGKAHPPNVMWWCEPERYELQLFQFGEPNVIARYVETRTFHDACRVALRNGEQYIETHRGTMLSAQRGGNIG